MRRLAIDNRAVGENGFDGHQTRWRQHLLAGVLVALVLALVVVAHNPAATGFRARWLIDDVTDLVGLGAPDYAFIQLNDSGEPAHWDPCKPIYYTVNPLHAPANWEAVVEEAVQATVDASGFDLRFVGTTADRDLHSSWRGEGAPVLIAWASASEAPGLSGGRVGYGGFASMTDGDQIEVVTGLVMLDAGAYSQMPLTGRTQDEVFILAHELGHVLGLSHVEDIDELMYPRYRGQDGFGSGDRDGFRVLRTQPCSGLASAQAR